ncbi:MAG: thiamine pyrophosphate-binding protein, partial [candidate division Zixibacteria bacterium]|nr:thiamine pyrophosphate-binding protein [candidate division Zixibacteria bacterium]
VRLAEKLSMPVATSLNGKGTIAENHPLSAGVVGTYSRKCANQIVAEADLVLFVGSHTGGQVSHFWQIPKPGTQVVQIDIDAVEIGRNYPVTVGIQADVRAALRRLSDTVPLSVSNPAWVERTRALTDEWRAEFEPLLASEATPIRPERLCREITDVLPDNAIFVSDTGHAGIWTGAMVELRHPDQRYLRCAGSLGWGFPAALGAKCAAPERPVVCFTGDGGFWYHLCEMETAVRSGIPTVTVINNNRSLNQCSGGFERAGHEAGGNGNELWMFSEVDFTTVARSMGCAGIRVVHPSDIRPALEHALTMDCPVVVDVVTDIEAMAPTAFVP